MAYERIGDHSKNVMRGRGWDFEGCAIEFGNEAPKFFARIRYEHLPPARECGMGKENQACHASALLKT